ncbi:SDR family NAD(P)-dependent oxidoreductase [Roseomonas alkaliterrae]|uniref:NAD(P)-dependent dehydrogenase (Short-subunit alcohol dehydrogenase family) n=1 Tax=Neoroseomonas alkaliterrae TaxID=1452450 RepID=A0A840XUW3_9PROT|nr:short-chain dehydrogenase/reductase [Neoroseomonas alkaliterrae]MBB5690860.1 NAD(P)-dependent dehydrogenase (short-subunit alcohol dehydrogenase family) [Neoroseomonas alkaliterrae]MBR0677744.1 SDR family NAD(P)-dependent oxidoreductase [Neoroseomonas alkaliterrae]
MEMHLRGRRVLVTGGSKGIGLACAEAFAAEGCDVVLSARDGAALAAAADQVRAKAQVRVETLAADLSREAERERLHAAFPDMDILVNNAGAIPAGRLQDIPIAAWKAAWDLKVIGYIHMCQLYLPAMEARKSGVIVNIIGMAGRAPRAGYIAGGAGNAALIAFTQALGAAAQANNVKVVGINPAVTRTERMLTQARTNAKLRFGDEERWAETLTDLPFGRPIEPGEIADLAVFLASPRGHYVNGTVVDVDGGGMFRA